MIHCFPPLIHRERSDELWEPQLPSGPGQTGWRPQLQCGWRGSPVQGDHTRVGESLQHHAIWQHWRVHHWQPLETVSSQQTLLLIWNFNKYYWNWCLVLQCKTLLKCRVLAKKCSYWLRRRADSLQFLVNKAVLKTPQWWMKTTEYWVDFYNNCYISLKLFTLIGYCNK